ncbi:MFS transporter [Streptomyces sp. RCU064]|uniref:MFS transporter n=1 Tax=Streptomyces rugosispiralis TaxID=2967341 RepID=A0ABT1UPT8_9ACTN|nr:MFS transporter [Streptomyces rugosispiralis]MCQ8187137.1 MFS transporter [Streptomyces rugosispiralis]
MALSNTTLGVLIATINISIMLIALPDIFRGIGVDPLRPGNTSLLLWLIMSYMVVTAVLVVSFGRLGDMFGRVRMYNLGFAVFTVFSVLLSVTWMHGTSAALWLIGMRVLQGVGGAMLMANSNAILTDAFPADQRGVGAGISTTFQNSATVLSIGIFFSLMIAGLAGSLPGALTHGLTAEGVPAGAAARVAALPPVGVLFASLLGYNPVKTLLGPQVLDRLPAHHAGYLTGRGFFPVLISPPFSQGLSAAFDFAIAACLVAAVASLLRGGRYVHGGGSKAGAGAPAVMAAVAGGSAGTRNTENITGDMSHPAAPAPRRAP